MEIEHTVDDEPKIFKDLSFEEKKTIIFRTLSHTLLNFFNIGQVNLFNTLLPSIAVQTGARIDILTNILLVGGLIGAILGNIFAGWWINRYPSHYVFTASATISAINMLCVPLIKNYLLVYVTAILLFQGIGVVDGGSYAALLWECQNRGIQNDGPYSMIKTNGTCLGLLVSAILAKFLMPVKATGKEDYLSIIYAWAGFLFFVSFLFYIQKSPQKVNLNDRSDAISNVVNMKSKKDNRRQLIFNLGGTFLITLMISMFNILVFLPNNYFQSSLARNFLIFILGITTLSVSFSALVLSYISAGKLLFGIMIFATIGNAFIAIAFFLKDKDKNMLDASSPYIWIGFGMLSLVCMVGFSATITFIAKYIKVSGRQATLLGLGAAFANGVAAVLLLLDPKILFTGISTSCFVIGAFIPVIEKNANKFLKKEM